MCFYPYMYHISTFDLGIGVISKYGFVCVVSIHAFRMQTHFSVSTQ